MNKTVTLAEARPRLSALIAEAGHEVFVRHGVSTIW
jgi:hypothetical protein